MEKILITQLSEPVRLFLDQAAQREGMIVEDETGRVRYGIVPYQEASPEERRLASQRLQAIQKMAGDRVRAAGKTEDELDRLLSAEE